MNTPARCDAAFSKWVVSRCVSALEAYGFTRYRKAECDWPLSADVHCWIGLNTGLNSEYVQINPFVGVHVVSIMKLCSRLAGRKYDRGIATYASHVGLLTPAEPVFRFRRETDVDVEAIRLARLYSTAGVAYAESIATYEDLLPLLESNLGSLGGFPERFAACLYLAGRKADAKNFAVQFLGREPAYFEGFAIPFLALCESQN